MRPSVVLYCYGVLIPRHGLRTVAELEAEGWTKSKPHPWYKDTWFMKKVAHETPRV